MNKELLLKNYEEFTYWLRGGDVYVRDNTMWVKLDAKTDMWDRMHSKAMLVMGDEFFELRKAEKDGSTLQFKQNFDKGFVDFHDHGMISLKEYLKAYPSMGTNHYRVKPTFVVPNKDSWIITEKKGLMRVKSIMSDGVNVLTYCKDILGPTEYTKWTPTEDEWTIFYDEQLSPNYRGDMHFKIARYAFQFDSGTFEGMFKTKREERFLYVAPFEALDGLLDGAFLDKC